MEKLAEDQKDVGDEILKIISNYKKDSSARKTLSYLEERLQRLETLWDQFETTDNIIRTKHSDRTDHRYFTQEYYTSVRGAYELYQSELSAKIKLSRQDSAAQAPITQPSVSKSAARQTAPGEGQGQPKQGDLRLDPPTMIDTLPARLIRKQRAGLQSICRLIESIERAELRQHSRQYCECNMRAIERQWAQLESCNGDLLELLDDPEASGYDTAQYVDLEGRVQAAIIKLSESLAQQSSSDGPINGLGMQLPKIVMPIFDGDYSKWRQFADLFTQMVHNQPMNGCQKMWYLKTNLTGEAEKLIMHLSLSNENYTSAWSMLNSRYENKRLLVSALLTKLTSQPKLQVESAAAIKALHDTTKETLMGLENLNVPTDNWDPLLLHILMEKIDRQTHCLYEQSLDQPRSLQTVKHFLQVLETRFQSLEALGHKGSPASEALKKSDKSSRKASTLVSTNEPFKCPCCTKQHQLYKCQKFLQFTPNNRLSFLKKTNLCVNCMRAGHIAVNCKLRGCTVCSKRHNSLVHLNQAPQEKTTAPQPNQVQSSTIEAPPENSVILTAQRSDPRGGYVLLSTVTLKLIAKDGSKVDCRAILDSGSQLNLITERMVTKLGFKGVPDCMQVQGIGQAKHEARHRINVTMQSRIKGFSTQLEAFILKQILPPQPSQRIDTSAWAIPSNIQLADPNFSKPNHVDLLIGAEHYYHLLSVGQIHLGDGLPVLQKTVLGWILAGKIAHNPLSNAICGIFSTNAELDQQLEKFWHLEETMEDRKALTPFEQRCEEHFNNTVKRTHSGRFVVKLPFLESSPRKLGESKDIAFRRFLAIERKLARNDELRSQYTGFMDEYRDLGHMQEVDSNKISSPHYFIPHHGVSKPDSTTTKLRVVFDASCKTSSNVSLNDLLATGPTVQDELFSILLRFRMPKFVYTADIEKMYRQILVDESDRKFQLIFWRNEPSQSVKCYQLNTVTYGTSSTPYLATKCLQKLAQDGSTKYPLGAQVLSRDFYVDDVMSGTDSLITAMEAQSQLRTLLQEAGFRLRKWCANHPQLLRNVRPEDRALQLTLDDANEDQIKILGLSWQPATDQFRIKTSWAETNQVSKRTICSDIARIFDPLGIMSPVVITAKMFLQELWKLKIDWDSSLPMELHTRWLSFRTSLQELNDVTFPRHVFAQQLPQSTQIHAFADASLKAYGAAIYLRSIDGKGQVIVRLLCAKSRVTPIKDVSIPRLELCAAKLAVEITKRVKGDLDLKDAPTHYWTDSEVVLGWLNSSSSAYHTFVANRVAAIQRLSVADQWRHVRSLNNPADLLTRGMSPRRLKECTLWFYGPLFLHGAEDLWPGPYRKCSECTLDSKRVACAATTRESHKSSIYGIDHRNSFARLQRVTAYTIRELHEALLRIVKIMQVDNFKDELNQLKEGELAKSSPLNELAPFLDEEGIMRVGGRLQKADVPYDTKHPILLPYFHPYTKLLMTDLHIQNLHVGPQTLLSITRQKFWPVKGKTIARSIVRNCVRCVKTKPTMLSQMMGSLPAHRVQPARPFVNAGVDFCGPVWTHFKIRGKHPQKSYIAVFCCFATKAIHLEVVSDLTTQAFLGALKRFTGRRGHCRKLYCDNATNFVGARNELKELNKAIHSDKAKTEISMFSESQGMDFNFIPPRAPHFGGLWEAAVKSAKHLLVRTVGNASLTYEELETVVIQIEAILNSRPLTSMSSNPNDLSALTPGHFLVGEPLTSSIDPRAEPERANLLTRWKRVNYLKNEFWKRWVQEYLNELQQRHKWKHPTENVKPGTMVIIQDDNLPPLKWPLGRIVDIIKGTDGLARVANVRVANGIIRRPIRKLAPLPIADESTEDPKPIGEPASGPSGATRNSEPVAGPSGKTRTRDPSSDDSDTEPSASKHTRLSLGHAITTLLLVCLCLPTVPASPIETTPFRGQIGLHFENLGTASIVSNEWSLVVYYDMTNYWKEFQGFLNGTQMLHDLCTSITRERSCETITTQMEHLREEISSNNQMLRPSANRVRRGAVNFVGNIANALFGVLDSEYAESMSQTIEAVKTNEEYLLSLIQNQTSIMDATVNLMKKNQEQVEQQFKDIEGRVSTLLNFTNIISMEIHQERLTLLFTSLAIQTILISSNIQRAQMLIMDVLADTHHGHVSPQLISPNQLRQQLFQIKGNLAPSVTLPVEPVDVLKLYNLMKVAARATEQHVIFKIMVPLLALDKFELFRVLPVPTLVNDTFIGIQPSSPFLIIDLHRDSYYPLSESGLQSCLSVQEDHHICKQMHPLYQRGSSVSSCEVGLINDKPLPSTCHIINLGNESQWIQMNNQNQWIFAVKENTVVKIVCGTNVTSTTIEGSGILKIKENCIIKQQHVTLQGHNIRPAIFRTSYTAIGAVTDMVKPEQLTVAVRPVQHPHSNSHDIEELKNKLNQQLSHSKLPAKIRSHDVHQLAVGYIAAAIAIAVAAWLLWKFTPNTCRPGSRKPIPLPRRRTTNDFTFNLETEDTVESAIQRGGGC